jgi:hypothetical protein
MRRGHPRDASAQARADLFVSTVGKERFLSERRTSLPDIALDVESERRLEVYDAIIERFGKERTAVTGMPETCRARQQRRPPTSCLSPGGSWQRLRSQPDVGQPLAHGPCGDVRSSWTEVSGVIARPGMALIA